MSFDKCATVYPDITSLKDILQAEEVEKQVQEMQEDIDWDIKALIEEELEFKLLITDKIVYSACLAVLISVQVSDSEKIWDKLWLLVWEHLDKRVSLVKLMSQLFKI